VAPAQPVLPRPPQAVSTGQPSSLPERRQTEPVAMPAAPAASAEPNRAQAAAPPPEPSPVQAAAPATPAATPKPMAAEPREDQPAFSAPSP
jgi:hypothetical protein